MGRNWHETFGAWAKAPSETEEAKGKRAADMISAAVRASPALASRSFEVYASGSYRNNTNVRLDSDIDVALVLKSAFYYELAPGLTTEMVGLTGTVTYGLNEFRKDVGEALVAKFGASGVTSGDKAFDVHENTVRLDADAAVFLGHRRYTGAKRPDGSWEYHLGVEMRPKSAPSRRIINWHQQHYDEGVGRNTATKRRYKRVARILKRLRTDMRESGIPAAKEAAAKAPSFLLECLAFNALDSSFNKEEGTYVADVRAVIVDLHGRLGDGVVDPKFLEVSGLKWLFAEGQPWTREDARNFLFWAWHHGGFAP
jgi:hypothetical protein